MKKFYVAETYRLENGKVYEVVDRSAKTIMLKSAEQPIFFSKKIKVVNSVEAVTLPDGILYANACVSRPWLND